MISGCHPFLHFLGWLAEAKEAESLFCRSFVAWIVRFSLQSFCPSWSPELANMVVETAAKPPGKAVKPGTPKYLKCTGETGWCQTMPAKSLQNADIFHICPFLGKQCKCMRSQLDRKLKRHICKLGLNCHRP